MESKNCHICKYTITNIDTTLSDNPEVLRLLFLYGNELIKHELCYGCYFNSGMFEFPNLSRTESFLVDKVIALHKKITKSDVKVIERPSHSEKNHSEKNPCISDDFFENENVKKAINMNVIDANGTKYSTIHEEYPSAFKVAIKSDNKKTFDVVRFFAEDSKINYTNLSTGVTTTHVRTTPSMIEFSINQKATCHIFYNQPIKINHIIIGNEQYNVFYDNY